MIATNKQNFRGYITKLSNKTSIIFKDRKCLPGIPPLSLPCLWQTLLTGHGQR